MKMSHARALRIPLLILFSFFSSLVFATGAEENYSSGLRLYQEGKYAEAAARFEETLKEQPHNPRALYNLGLNELKLGKPGSAIARWRAAGYVAPFSLGEKTRAAVEFATAQLKVKALPHQISSWETLRSAWIVKIPTHLALGLTLLALLTFGWLLLNHLRERREIESENLSRPSLGWPAALSSAILLLGLLTSVGRAYDYLQPRGTIVTPKIEARTGPSSDQSAVVELYEGLEVLLEQTFVNDLGDKKERWVQITYPGGQTGWIPDSAVFPTSGRPLW